MIHLCYVSSAIKKVTQNGLVELLTNALEKNAVKALYGTITKDGRHQGLIVIDEDALAERQFSDWSMGFSNLADPAVMAMRASANSWAGICARKNSSPTPRAVGSCAVFSGKPVGNPFRPLLPGRAMQEDAPSGHWRRNQGVHRYQGAASGAERLNELRKCSKATCAVWVSAQ